MCPVSSSSHCLYRRCIMTPSAFSGQCSLKALKMLCYLCTLQIIFLFHVFHVLFFFFSCSLTCRFHGICKPTIYGKKGESNCRSYLNCRLLTFAYILKQLLKPLNQMYTDNCNCIINAFFSLFKCEENTIGLPTLFRERS